MGFVTYAIVAEQDFREGVAKLAAFHENRQASGKQRPIPPEVEARNFK